MLAHGKDGHASHFHQRIRVPNGRIRAGLARINGNCEMTKHECEWLATDVVMVGKIACESAPHLGRGDALTGHNVEKNRDASVRPHLLRVYPSQLTPIATTVADITTVAAQPRTRSGMGSVKPPMMAERIDRCIMMTITGTATTPFRTALQ
ncbi:hypothetical protein AWB81_05679 [Caballeronia arationis]|nr:hypothetical protein AWB81_05679 [Caballeronia arationis]